MTPETTLAVRVAQKTVEATGIISLELVASGGESLPPFAAGSHVDVLVPGSNPPITRQYSLCNDPHETHRYQIAVLLDPASRGGSVAMHQLVPGDIVQISTPKNHFELAHEAREHLLLAGGIGITPILCMAERLATIGAAFSMHYCARARERTAFYDRIAAAPYAPSVQFHFDDGPPEQQLDIATLLADPASGRHLYVCGPKGFMDAVLGSARKEGWPEAQLHFEFFGAAVAPSADDVAFEVQLASSGLVITIASDQTVTQALAAAGVAIPTSCEQGVCGTCLTRVISGIPDHKDLYLMAEEQTANDQFLPCCSRSKTPRLVLDL